MDALVEVGPARIETEEWTTTQVRFRGFAGLNAGVGDCEESPVFTCCGNQWSVKMYPGGTGGNGEGGSRSCRMTSLYLTNRSNSQVDARYEFILRAPDGGALAIYQSGLVDRFCEYDLVDIDFCMGGTSEFVSRMMVKQFLVEGAMVVDVKIMIIDEVSKSSFVPENPHLKNSANFFMDEETADVIFTVGIQNTKKKGKRKRDEESTNFYAHRLVLKHNAPVLAEFCRPGEGEGALPVTVPIEDVDADIFRHLLHYVYGGEIKGEDLKERAKEIINAADRYGVVGLKLLAEARYVESTKLSIENVMEHLLFADAKNCALMKEAVMDFVLANDEEVLEKVSFHDCPGDLMKDLLAAMAQSKKKGKSDGGNAEGRFLTMRVDDLRRKLHEKGLDIDGSREAMIAALRENS